MSRNSPNHTQFTLRRRFHASREAVFRAWTDPEILKQWFGTRDGVPHSLIEVDLRIGGTFRIVAVSSTGELNGISGTYLEIRPPERLVFTWKYDHNPLQPDESLVTIEFVEIGEEVEIVLTHERLDGDEMVEQHREGWTGVFDNFERYTAHLH